MPDFSARLGASKAASTLLVLFIPSRDRANHAIDQAFPESTLEFSAIVEKEDKLYVARVPAFGVKGYGATRSEALETARNEVIERIRELRTQGKGLPKEERIRLRLTGDNVQ